MVVRDEFVCAGCSFFLAEVFLKRVSNQNAFVLSYVDPVQAVRVAYGATVGPRTLFGHFLKPFDKPTILMLPDLCFYYYRYVQEEEV